MSLESALKRGRVAAEARMTSRVTVGRRTGDTTDNADGMEVDEWAPVLRDVPFRLMSGPPASPGYRIKRVGDSEVHVALRTGSFPVGTPDLQERDIILITKGEHAGLALAVAETAGRDQGSAYRVPLFEVDLPEGWTA